MVGILETHLRGDKAAKVEAELEAAGWDHYLHSRAATSTSAKGTSGGALLLYKSSLQTAVPIEAFGTGSHQLPEGDLTWIHIRVQGLHFVIAFTYLDHSIGLAGANLDKLHRINLLRDGGRRKVIVCGDFN